MGGMCDGFIMFHPRETENGKDVILKTHHMMTANIESKQHERVVECVVVLH